MSSSLEEIKAHLEIKKAKAKVNQALRVIQKTWLGRKFKLHALFDDCMAYFTGYKSTKIFMHSAEEFLSLASKCADYCNRLQDKESLQLLMYAVVRRVYERRPYGFEFGLLVLLDCIQGDTTGVYQNDRMNQIGDTTEIFKVLLLHIEANGKDKVNFKPLLKETKAEASTPSATGDTAIWHEKFHFDKKLEEAVPFSRGGGLYNFLDMQKGIMPGMKDDTDTLNAIYVTPEKRTQRDEFYAYDPGGCRLFLDKPSIQSGSIAARNLKSSNFNSYEALIEVQNFSEIKDLRIQVSETAYLDENCILYYTDFFPQLKASYLVNSDKKRMERLSMIEEISFASMNRLEVRKELLTKDNLNPVLKGYINQLKLLCQKYRKHDYLSSEKKRIIASLESLLTLDETQPLIRGLKSFAQKIKANREQLCSLEKTFAAFSHDVFVLIVRAISFNYLAANSPLFFSNRNVLFTNEISEIAEEAINKFTTVSATLL